MRIPLPIRQVPRERPARGVDWPLLGLIAVGATFLWLAHEVSVASPILIDEYGHIPAGVSYWDLGRFYIYRENPPLVQALAALPVWLSGARMDYSRAHAQQRSEWGVGIDFVNANAADSQRYVLRARSVIVLLAIACGVLIFRWAGELHGRAAGVVCAAVWFLDPTVLAFSTVVTTDLGAATFACLAAYAFWRFLLEPCWMNVLLGGVALGLAQGSKFSLLVLFPAWVVQAYLARRAASPPASVANLPGRTFWIRLASLLGIGLLTLNALYQFDGLGTPLRAYSFMSHNLSGVRALDDDAARPANRFRGTILGDLPAPLPKDYLLGLDRQKSEEEYGFLRLSGGKLVRGGRWYDPFAILGEKLPLGTLLLVGAALVLTLPAILRPPPAPGAIWIPPLLMLALLCSQTGLNWIIRYQIILFPFVFIGVGRLVEVARRRTSARLLVVACLLWNAGTLLRTRPDYLSYGNELVGGPAGAQRTFLGSNFDWGQDLLRLKQWCDEHPEAQPVALSYYGFTDPASIGLRVRPLPACFDRSRGTAGTESEEDRQDPFYWAISSNVLHGLPGSVMLDDGPIQLGLVRSPLLKPENAVARAGPTIFVFRIGTNRGASKDRAEIPHDRLHGCTDINADLTNFASP